jgi:hypothetical protein
MEMKESQIASCVTVHSCHEQNEINVYFVRFMALPHMHQERPWVVGWGKPNLVRNVKEKMSKAILKDGMTGWAKS